MELPNSEQHGSPTSPHSQTKETQVEHSPSTDSFAHATEIGSHLQGEGRHKSNGDGVYVNSESKPQAKEKELERKRSPFGNGARAFYSGGLVGAALGGAPLEDWQLKRRVRWYRRLQKSNSEGISPKTDPNDRERLTSSPPDILERGRRSRSTSSNPIASGDDNSEGVVTEDHSRHASSQDARLSDAHDNVQPAHITRSESIHDPGTTDSKYTETGESAEIGIPTEQPQQQTARQLCFTCRCGKKIYDEYTELRPGALDRLQRHLTSVTNRAPNTLSQMPLLQHALLIGIGLSWVSYIVIISVQIARILSYYGNGDQTDLLIRAISFLESSANFLTFMLLSVLLARHAIRNLGASSETSITHSTTPQDFHRQSTNGGSKRSGGYFTKLPPSIGNLMTGSKEQQSSLPTHHGEARLQPLGKDASLQKERKPDDSQYLLLCVPYKRHANRLLNVNTSDLVTDQSFFRLLRRAYASHRGRFRHLLSVRALSEIRFVQFEVFRNELVDVTKYDTIPPLAEKHRYVYSPMPAEYIPPIGKNRMRHLYDHPEDADDLSLCFSRVPRKLRERLSVVPSVGRNEGWGICFIEGVSWPRVCLLGLMGVLASTIFGIVWTLVQDDIQGGFGVASYMLGVLVLGLGALQGSFEV